MSQKIFALMLVLLVVVGCSDSKKKEDAKDFEHALEAKTGQSFKIAKLNTEKGKFVVFKNETTGEYVAYNLGKWDPGTMTTFDQYMANGVVEGVDIIGNLNKDQEWKVDGYYESVYTDVYDTYTEYDSYCDCYKTKTETRSVYVGERWVDTSRWYTFYTGGGFRFENTAGRSKDLETIAALKEEVALEFMSYKFKSEFSLSDNRADELARLASRYQKLENARELTTNEKDKFAMDALGVSMNQMESALKAKAEGNDSKYEELLETAAQVNNTTPEQIGKFFNEMVLE